MNKNYLEKLSKKEYTYDLGKSTKYFINEGFTKIITEIDENKNMDYIDLLSQIYDNDLKYENFETPLIFINKEKKIYELLKPPDKKSNKSKNLKDYLIKIKKVLFLQNDIEEDFGDKKSLKSILNYKTDNFVITEDSFKKMILLIYRIQANIPVIIMGETGCGKTLLVIKLSQILNNGEIKVRIINLHPDITEEDICKEMKRINEEAKCVKDEIWIFFDDINTCQSLSLLTEIFNNRTYNGEKINENIRLIGACTPYRKRKYIEKYELSLDNENEKENEFVYSVQLLPQSLFYYVFNFGIIDVEDEKEYIYKIIENLFSKEEQKLHDMTSDTILKCHQFLRNIFDPSIISLRDISRFYKCAEFLQKYFSIKDEYLNKDIKGKEKLYKIKSIICSIYICYYFRLNVFCRANFESNLYQILLELVNVDKELKEENEDDYKGIFYFSKFLESEEEFLLDLMELDKGIAKTTFLKEKVFLSFISINTKIPLIIIGKPGSGKCLSAQLVYKSFKGKYSKNKFFRKFSPIILTYFQGSEFTNPEDVEKLFEKAENKYRYFIDKKNNIIKDFPISIILFDHLKLTEKSETSPLKILHSKLDYNTKNKGISFIGFSNCTLDPSIMNRALTLSVPNLEKNLDDLLLTSEAIAVNISEDLFKNQKELFYILVKAYKEYKDILKILKKLTVLKKFSLINKESKNPIDLWRKQFWEIKRMEEYIKLFIKEEKIKVDFHGNLDFYNFIKDIAIELTYFKDKEVIIDIIEKFIERNFGGIDYEIDIDFDLIIDDDLQDKIYKVHDIFRDFRNKEKIKFSSVFLFKKVYNLILKDERQNDDDDESEESQYDYKIRNEGCERYDLFKCINDNINDTNNSRYLLLEINPILSSLIYQIIKSKSR